MLLLLPLAWVSSSGSLARLVAAIAEAKGELRVVHLRAHIQLRPLLTDAQVSRYQQARGYGG